MRWPDGFFFCDQIGWQQIVGSAVDIAIRLVFVFRKDLMFKKANDAINSTLSQPFNV